MAYDKPHRWKLLLSGPPKSIRSLWLLPLSCFNTTRAPGQRRSHLRRVLRSFLKQSGLGYLWSRFWVAREERKIILDRGAAAVLARTAFHFIALSMTAVLSYLHISGFYIGGTLEGWNGSSSEAIKQLLIQVAAKMLELIVIGSLTTIVIDVVRSFLLDTSIPLGMLTAHIQFSDPKYFISEDFWAGHRGFEKKHQFWSVAFLFMLCGMLALLTGPATAVLLVPVWRTMWYAGGTGYWLAGSPETLWPQHLTIAHIGTGFSTQNCLDGPGVGQVDQLISLAGCTWAGYGGLRADYGESHQNPDVNVTLSDGFQNRLLQRIVEQYPEPYTIAPHAAVTDPTYNFGYSWTASFRSIRGVSSYAHYKRTPGGSTFNIQTYVPIVRAKCNMYPNSTSPDTYWEYPYLPPRGSVPGTFYRFPKLPLLNSSRVAVSWLVPNGTIPLNNGSVTTVPPSAFVNVQLPRPLDVYMTCAVDARWINTTIVGAEFDPDVGSKYFVYAQIPSDLEANNTPYPGKSNFTKVTIDNAWLEALTPPIRPEGVPSNVTVPGYNTLADILQVMSLLNGFTDITEVSGQIESVIATVVADGMSRIGYAANGGNITLWSMQGGILDRYKYNVSFDTSSQWGQAVYQKGEKAMTPFVQGYDASNSTYVRLNMFLQGYSYKADSPTYWIALALLYVHALLALGHLTYKLLWKWGSWVSSVSWGGPTDIVALAMVSELPQGSDKLLLRNTCGGADSLDVLAVRIGARVVEDDVDGTPGEGTQSEEKQREGEQVRLFFPEGIQSEGLGKVEPGRSYGARAQCSTE